MSVSSRRISRRFGLDATIPLAVAALLNLTELATSGEGSASTTSEN